MTSNGFRKVTIAQIDRELVRRGGFRAFCEIAFPQVIQNEYVHSKHLDIIAGFCEDIWKGNIKRGLINVPPASSKSTIISVLFPAWCWIQNPKYKICTVSYSPEISTFFSNKTLELIRSEWFQQRWPIKLKSSSKIPKGDYSTVQGGRRFATSIGSKLTGLHFDAIFADDPLKAQDKLARHEEVREFFREVLPTRLIDQNQGKIVCIMQRLKPYDVSQMLLESGWESLILPMEFDPARADKRDYRTTRGEILNPRISPEALVNLKNMLGDYSYAQLQQDPIDVNECIFKKDYFEFISGKDIPAKFDEYLVSIDPATYGKETSDYSAIVILGKTKDRVTKEEKYYVLDSYRYKMDFIELRDKIRMIYLAEKEKHPNARMLIEDKALGPALYSQLTADCSVSQFKALRSKEERAHSITHLFRTKNVLICDHLSEFVKELQEFPNSKNDDQVDAFVQGLIHLSDRPKNYWSTL